MNLDDKNKEISAAVNSRLSQLQAAIEKHEESLKAMGIYRDTSCTYRTEILEDEQGNYQGAVESVLGIIKYGPNWRLCHGLIETGSHPDYGPEWKPLVDSPVPARIEAVAYIDKLREAIVADKEAIMPELEAAIAVAVNSLDDYGLQPVSTKPKRELQRKRDKKQEALTAWFGDPNIRITKAPNSPDIYQVANLKIEGFNGAPLVECFTEKQDAEDADAIAKRYPYRTEITHQDGTKFIVYHKFKKSKIKELQMGKGYIIPTYDEVRTAVLTELGVQEKTPELESDWRRNLKADRAWIDWGPVEQTEGFDGTVLIRFTFRGGIDNHLDSQMSGLIGNLRDIRRSLVAGLNGRKLTLFLEREEPVKELAGGWGYSFSISGFVKPAT